jgi:putative SOS response-associated peptidase YedK
MCYHKSLKAKLPAIAAYYKAEYGVDVSEQYKIYYHENGYDFKPSPLVTAQEPQTLVIKNWGLIPWFTKKIDEALQIRIRTLNCKSEEMYKTASFRDAAKNGQRCLVPATGFFEPHWLDPKGKSKVPYYLHLKDQEIFSFAGLYSKWKDPETEKEYFTYTLLTTESDKNSFIGKIHNSKDRKVVIIPREYEKDFLNPDLKPEDVIELSKAFNGTENNIEAYTVSQAVHHAKIDSDKEDILKPVPLEVVPTKPKDIQGPLF